MYVYTSQCDATIIIRITFVGREFRCFFFITIVFSKLFYYIRTLYTDFSFTGQKSAVVLYCIVQRQWIDY